MFLNSCALFHVVSEGGFGRQTEMMEAPEAAQTSFEILHLVDLRGEAVRGILKSEK